MDDPLPPEDAQSGSQVLKETLNRAEVPDFWESVYRSAACESFYERAFDVLAARIAAPAGTPILDTGCGGCDHAMRLARRGFRVSALDFSDTMLGMARQRVREAGLADRLSLCRGSLLELPFRDGAFPFVLCWGVLMHVSEVERAIGELARVVAPGGLLILAESNMGSLQSRVQRLLERAWNRPDPGRRRTRRTAAGIDTWVRTPGGWLLARQSDIGWLQRQFGGHGFRLEERMAGQFSELYRKTSSPLVQSLVHGFNDFWFRFRFPRLAFGNLLLLRKTR